MAFGPDKKSGSRDLDGYGYGSTDSASGSFFGKTMKIEGEITSDENLTIEGKVNGQLKVSKTLTIGKEGYVNGEISANVVHISGEAEGHITASEKLEISSHGKFSGNIKSDIIVVAEGAVVKGTINLEDKKDITGKMTQPDTAAETKSPGKKEEPKHTAVPEKQEKKEQPATASGTSYAKQE